jgi:FkbM family methyltransferase
VNVTQVSTWQVQCGIAEYTELLCRGLERHGVSSEVVPIDRDHTAYLTQRELRDYFDGLGRQLAEAELIHIQHEFAFFSGSYHFRSSVANFHRMLKAAQKGGRPVLVTFHTSPFYVDWSKINWTTQDPIRQALLRGAKAWWRAEVVSFINRHAQICSHVHGRTGRRLLIDSGIKPDRIAVIAHGTPSPWPAASGPSRIAVRERLGLAEDATVLGIFGFLASSKGQADALTALEHLPEEFQLLLIGGPHPGDDRSALGEIMERIRQKPQLSDRVAVTGFLDEAEAQACLGAVDIMIAPYRDKAQTVSGAFGWALASGKPVIASRIPAFRELVHETGCAELVAPEAPGELALAIQKLAADPELRGQLVSNARAWCEANNWDAVAGRHAELYANLLDGTKRMPTGVVTPSRSGGPIHAASKWPLRTAGADADPLILGPPQDRPRRLRASAVLRAAALPDGRTLTFALDPNANDPLARVVLERGYPADLPCELVLHLLRPGATLVDVGAHLGTFALAAAALECRVVAFDASVTNVRLLRTAVAYNGFDDRVDVIHAAAAATSGTVAFRDNGPYGEVAVTETPANGARPAEPVPAVRVDDVLAELGVEVLDVLKLDVEGYELEVLDGLERALAAAPPPWVVFESNGPALGRRGRTIRELKEALSGFGYSLFLIDRLSPGRLIPVSVGDVQTEGAADYLAARGDRTMLAPWRVAEPLNERQVVERLRAEAESEQPGLRAYVAAVLQIAEPAITEDPLMRATLLDLRRDRDPEVLQVAEGRRSVGEYGLTADSPSAPRLRAIGRPASRPATAVTPPTGPPLGPPPQPGGLRRR